MLMRSLDSTAQRRGQVHRDQESESVLSGHIWNPGPAPGFLLLRIAWIYARRRRSHVYPTNLAVLLRAYGDRQVLLTLPLADRAPRAVAPPSSRIAGLTREVRAVPRCARGRSWGGHRPTAGARDEAALYMTAGRQRGGRERENVTAEHVPLSRIAAAPAA